MPIPARRVVCSLPRLISGVYLDQGGEPNLKIVDGSVNRDEYAILLDVSVRPRRRLGDIAHVDNLTLKLFCGKRIHLDSCPLTFTQPRDTRFADTNP